MHNNYPAKLFFIVLLGFITPLSQADNRIVVNSSANQTAVVELYTSEGCSSCPPADRWLNQLIQTPKSDLDVLALAFHVDYWDYIGWKDEFASPKYTDRQRRLARINQQSSIYTPEFFVGGLEARGTLSILDKIKQTNKSTSPIDLTLSIQMDNEQYMLELTSQTGVNQDYKVQFVIFEDNLSNQVERGENAGRKLSHQRVVRSLSPTIDFVSPVNYSVQKKPDWLTDNQGVAALVTTGDEEYVQSVFTLMSPP